MEGEGREERKPTAQAASPTAPGGEHPEMTQWVSKERGGVFLKVAIAAKRVTSLCWGKETEGDRDGV